MRLIDADEMMRWYKAKFPFKHSDVRFSMNDIAYNTFNIPSLQWIPVSKGLPKKKGYYLVTRKNPKGHVTNVLFDPSKVERGVYNSPWGNGDSDILAWMPLPKPYEVEEE